MSASSLHISIVPIIRESSCDDSDQPESSAKKLDLINLFKKNKRPSSPNGMSITGSFTMNSPRHVPTPVATVNAVVEKVRVNPLGPLLRKQKRPTIKIVKKSQQVLPVVDGSLLNI